MKILWEEGIRMRGSRLWLDGKWLVIDRTKTRIRTG